MRCPSKKAQYKKKRLARKAQTYYNSENGYRMHVYKCHICRDWHLSKFRGRVKYMRQCEKSRFKYSEDADIELQQKRAAGIKYIRKYQCQTCKGWHLTQPKQ